MATFFDDVYKDVKTIWNDISQYIPLVDGNGRAINDINKAANKNTVNLYCVLSDNVPASVANIIARNMYIKYMGAIVSILQNTVLKDPKEAGEFFSKKLSYTRSDISKYVDTVAGSAMIESFLQNNNEDDLNDLIENIVINGESISSNNIINEAKAKQPTAPKFNPANFKLPNSNSSPNKHTAATGGLNSALPHNDPAAKVLRNTVNKSLNNSSFGNKSASLHADKLVHDSYLRTQEDWADEIIGQSQRHTELETRNAELKQNIAKNTLKNDIEQLKEKQRKIMDSTVNLRIDDTDEKYFGGNKSHNAVYLNFGGLIHASFKILDTNLSPVAINISFNLHVKMMRIEGHKIREVIKSTKERDNFFQYLKYRAGGSEFFKDFILNLKEIDKEVERKTSQKLPERILTDIVRTSGLLTPKILGDINETRHYTLILDKSDVDDLRRVERIDVESRGHLDRIFNNLRILDLIICNADRSELTFYSSSDPHNYDIQNYAKLTNDEDALKRFISNMRS
jgi:hypothetical protein